MSIYQFKKCYLCNDIIKIKIEKSYNNIYNNNIYNNNIYNNNIYNNNVNNNNINVYDNINIYNNAYHMKCIDNKKYIKK